MSSRGKAESTKPEEEIRVKDLAEFITASGHLATLEHASNVKLEQFSVEFHGVQLVQDTTLDLNVGRRYGFLGANGSGKSSTLTALGRRMVPIPEHISMWHLDREVAPSDMSALECVIADVGEEVARLEDEAEELCADDPESDRLFAIYDRIDELDPDMAEVRAGKILHGLGFDKAMQAKAAKDFSGGWRMRIALAKALFRSPDILLLDDPTNHLDQETCIWLEEYLKSNYRDDKGCLVVVSHSQDFLNAICNETMHLRDGKLKYYGGNYDAYVKARAELEDNQMKRHKWEQGQIANMKNYIARFGHGTAKNARQAKSREKQLAKMQAKGLTEAVKHEAVVNLYFPETRALPPPVVAFTDVSFGYNPKQLLFQKVEFGLDMDSRVALVGPNGAGKSTLLKLLLGELEPTGGVVRRHQHLRIGWFHQHLHETLDQGLSPLQYLKRSFPDIEREDLRRAVGRFGVTGPMQTRPISFMSDGQKSRLVFAHLAMSNPGMLALDEPTNGLDMETIDSLAHAINEYNGGLILVSHDFRLISQVAKEIWVCDKGTVTPYTGDISSYKEELRAKVLSEQDM